MFVSINSNSGSNEKKRKEKMKKFCQFYHIDHPTTNPEGKGR